MELQSIGKEFPPEVLRSLWYIWVELWETKDLKIVLVYSRSMVTMAQKVHLHGVEVHSLKLSLTRISFNYPYPSNYTKRNTVPRKEINVCP